MSKTVSTCILETNQVLNQPQENVFFHTIYRTQADYPNEFLRTARSTSPIQICAIFSSIGPDSLGALLNIQLNEELGKIVASCQNHPVLDFVAFTNQVVNTLNIKVCNFNVSRGGVSMKVSMTMIVVEGDTLRVVHIGNTKAVLVRDNKVMALTEEHTVAHNYVKANAITLEQERTHPDNMNLTQYLGKLPQDGVLNADSKVRVKLKDGDEICLMGLGISRLMLPQMRNSILVKSLSSENKARELINSAYNYGIKSGLSVCLMQIESTFLLPGDAEIKSNLATEAPIAAVKPRESNVESYTPLNEPTGSYADDYNDDTVDEGTQKFALNDNAKDRNVNNMKHSDNNKKKSKPKLWDILVPIITLLVFIGIGYGTMYLVFNAKHLLDKVAPKETEIEVTDVSIIRYATNDNTPVYSASSVDSSSIAILARGEAVTTYETENGFYRIDYNGTTAYVLVSQLSDYDPTIGEEIPEIVDPTPVPSEQVVEQTTQAPAATTAAVVETADPTTAATTTVAPETSATETTAETTVAETTASTEPTVQETTTASDNSEGNEDAPQTEDNTTPEEG